VNEDEACRSCVFFHAGGLPGHCRRKPPRVVGELIRLTLDPEFYEGSGVVGERTWRDLRGAIYEATVFPVVYETDWCGEYRAMPQSQAVVQSAATRTEFNDDGTIRKQD
jgi:hypothetical protein